MKLFEWFAPQENNVSKIYQAKTDEKISSEKSTWENYENPAYAHQPFNPDDIYHRWGGYSVYEEMLKDEQVKICMQMKKDLIIGNGWIIDYEDEEDAEMAKELTTMLKEDPLISFDESLEEIAGTAFEFGFSVSEKVFTVKEGGVTLKYIKTRHPASWEIHTDKFGNVETYYNDVTGSLAPIPSNSLMHYVNNRKFQNPYGESDLRAAHAAWIAKRHIIRFYSIFMERAAGPTPIAKIPESTAPNVRDTIFEMVKRLQSKTAMAVPKELEIEFLEAKNKGEAYDKAINIFNMMIGRALLTPDLVGISGSETSGGSFSLGQKQYDLFLMHIEKRRGVLERLINQEILKPLIIWNYGLIDRFPKFKFKPLTEDNKYDMAKLWIDLVRTKAFKLDTEQFNHFNEIVGFPKVEELEEIPAPQNPFAPNDPEFPNGSQISEPEDGMEVDEVDVQEKDVVEDEPEDEGKKPFAVYKKPEGDYGKKVNFTALKGQLDGSRETLMANLDPIVRKIWVDLADQVEKKKIIEKKKIDRIETLKVKNLKQIQLELKNAFRDFYKVSSKTAMSELFKQNFSENLLPDEVLKLFEQETFQYVGDYEYNTLKKAKQSLRNALKDGMPLSAVVDIYTTEGIKDSAVSLERFARTKLTEVMNKARLETFKESGVVSAYQYSAIMDDRTSEICSALHGAIFKAGTQPIPPMHFNCRSVLIPITRFEDYKPDNVTWTTTDKKDKAVTTVTVKKDGKTKKGDIGGGFSIK